MTYSLNPFPVSRPLFKPGPPTHKSVISIRKHGHLNHDAFLITMDAKNKIEDLKKLDEDRRPGAIKKFIMKSETQLGQGGITFGHPDMAKVFLGGVNYSAYPAKEIAEIYTVALNEVLRLANEQKEALSKDEPIPHMHDVGNLTDNSDEEIRLLALSSVRESLKVISKTDLQEYLRGKSAIRDIQSGSSV